MRRHCPVSYTHLDVYKRQAYYFLSWRVFSELSFHTQGFRPAIELPLVCLLFAYLAARAVFRDELMVRAADRIRLSLIHI